AAQRAARSRRQCRQPSEQFHRRRHPHGHHHPAISLCRGAAVLRPMLKHTLTQDQRFDLCPLVSIFDSWLLSSLRFSVSRWSIPGAPTAAIAASSPPNSPPQSNFSPRPMRASTTATRSSPRLSLRSTPKNAPPSRPIKSSTSFKRASLCPHPSLCTRPYLLLKVLTTVEARHIVPPHLQPQNLARL